MCFGRLCAAVLNYKEARICDQVLRILEILVNQKHFLT